MRTLYVQIGELVNLIYIVSDSFRADYLGCYGNSWVKTPNIDRFASESVLFENAYIEGFPTPPARYNFLTGNFCISEDRRGWEPLKKDEVTLPRILGRIVRTKYGAKKENYTSILITDVYHYFKGMNFHRGFNSFRWIRGQEFDTYNTDAKIGVEELKKHMTPTWESQEARWTRTRDRFHQYYRNIADRRYEEDYFVAKTVREGIKWLEDNYTQEKIFLFLDSFDPHEPWDPPEHYYNMYRDPEYEGPTPIWAGFTSPFPKDYTEDELYAIKAAYAGEVSLVDHWVGRLLKKIELLGLKDDTLVIFTSDHGTSQGEHGFICKRPYYRENTRIPLIMRIPNGPKNKIFSQLVWAPDILPTILDILGVKVNIPFHGKSFWPIIQGEKEKSRDFVVCWKRYVTDGEWSYIHGPRRKDELYYLKEDPEEKRNLISEYPKKVEEMKNNIEKYKQMIANYKKSS